MLILGSKKVRIWSPGVHTLLIGPTCAPRRNWYWSWASCIHHNGTSSSFQGGLLPSCHPQIPCPCSLNYKTCYRLLVIAVLTYLQFNNWPSDSLRLLEFVLFFVLLKLFSKLKMKTDLHHMEFINGRIQSSTH